MEPPPATEPFIGPGGGNGRPPGMRPRPSPYLGVGPGAAPARRCPKKALLAAAQVRRARPYMERLTGCPRPPPRPAPPPAAGDEIIPPGTAGADKGKAGGSVCVWMRGGAGPERARARRGVRAERAPGLGGGCLGL